MSAGVTSGSGRGGSTGARIVALLGDIMKVFKLDDSIERVARALIQAEINRQVAANAPQNIGKIGTIYIDDLAFTTKFC